MNIPESMKNAAGRWVGTRYTPAAPAPREPLPVSTEITGRPVPQPYSTPRAAITLMTGEQVYAEGRWYTVAKVDIQRHELGPARVLLHMADGTIVESRFDLEHTSRDIEEQAAAGGAA